MPCSEVEVALVVLWLCGLWRLELC